ncbi:MAG: bifunctional serine/threonine-protein kinase/formylglycine-generating enzyme family protein [Lentisphaerales bacterium]|nr:bifunctional serine/threonine-protein kinase/formylglycine-generating enzyme family protein [Lentisphaerales bacterium]
MMKFGKYNTDKKLGQGAMGEVFYGHHPNLDIPIAIKTLSKSLVNNEQFIDRFIREAKMAAKIKHENAIMIYDADQEGEDYFIVMEYVAGGNLGDEIKKRGKIPQDEALHITRCIASALKAAAQFEIIHRDIKPDNIMLSEDGTPKLADLGIAKQKSAENPTTTMTGVIVGTPAFLAPEQAQNSKRVDARADIYSLGCTLFNMLCGDYPYTGDNSLSIMMKHINDEIPDIRSKNPAICESVALMLKCMMAKNPNDRPQSAQELIKQIDEIKHQTPQVNTSGKKQSDPNQFLISKKTLAITISLIMVISILAITLALLSDNSFTNKTLKAKVPSPENRSPLLNLEPNDSATVETISVLAIPDLDIEMIRVKSGSFLMGAGKGEPQTDADETQHRVTLTEDFYLSKLEISVAAWKVFVAATSYQSVSEERGWSSIYNDQGNWSQRIEGQNWTTIGLEEDDAISMITFNDCLKFCNWLNDREKSAGRLPNGYEYTLPSEAQWEYACRAGSQSAFANNMSIEDLGWSQENSNRTVHKRGLKKPNAWGFYDMHGNVWEFCLDRSQGQGFFDVRTDNYNSTVTDPLSERGSRTVYRGGSFPDRANRYCRSASRGHSLPDYSSNNHGFRLCLTKIRDRN